MIVITSLCHNFATLVDICTPKFLSSATKMGSASYLIELPERTRYITFCSPLHGKSSPFASTK
ncbi:hypothetical protein AciX8_4066 [Granulicella mallensis MP5ACTX8]|uniref:Uncharacterized protein n=1 Tax=Granulicella mallensis (strain ATCC BAA-1857 / DSM 23137 / MP5ACTX8) TaxID=682795 RepID=G8NQ13_GRAMM|nr:hypothetical protein AciX8_4066 [Granulicella mallensis MP5ACTX8]